MDLGKLRHRIEIYTVTGVDDGIGGQTTNKELSATVWANVTTNQGTRTTQFQTVFNKTPYTITIRTDAYAITSENLINWQGKEMTIHSVQVDELKRFTTITAWD